MKTVIKILAGLLIAFGLIQLADLGFYLMNQPDTFVFNLGIVVLAIVGIAVAYLGLYLLNILKPEQVEQNIEKEKQE